MNITTTKEIRLGKGIPLNKLNDFDKKEWIALDELYKDGIEIECCIVGNDPQTAEDGLFIPYSRIIRR